MVWRPTIGAITLSIISAACAGTESRNPASPTEPSTVPETAPQAVGAAKPVDPAAAASTTSGPMPAASGSASAASPATAGSADSTAAPAGGDETAAQDPDRPRNVRYVVNPGSMQVAVEGITFVPKAELVKSGKGFSVRIRVEASARDSAPHTILAPKRAELAVSGTIHRHDKSAPESFTDRREDDHVITVKGPKPVTLSRTWPGPKGPEPLSQGDEIELVVGLWGLGSEGFTSRPLKRLCRFRGKIEQGVTRLKVEPPPGVEMPQEALP